MCDKLEGYVHDVYRHLHKIPEKAMEEYQTSEFLAKSLESFGFLVERNVGVTGVVGILDSGIP